MVSWCLDLLTSLLQKLYALFINDIANGAVYSDLPPFFQYSREPFSFGFSFLLLVYLISVDSVEHVCLLRFNTFFVIT